MAFRRGRMRRGRGRMRRGRRRYGKSFSKRRRGSVGRQRIGIRF